MDQHIRVQRLQKFMCRQVIVLQKVFIFPLFFLGEKDDPDAAVAGRDCLKDFNVAHFLDFIGKAVSAAVVKRQKLLHDIGGIVAGYVHLTFAAACADVPDFFVFSEYDPCASDKNFAFARQCHAGGGAPEYHVSQFGLQRLDGAAQIGLREIEVLGCFPD